MPEIKDVSIRRVGQLPRQNIQGYRRQHEANCAIHSADECHTIEDVSVWGAEIPQRFLLDSFGHFLSERHDGFSFRNACSFLDIEN